MALRTEFKNLTQACHNLGDALRDLSIAVSDRPLADDVKLVEIVSDAIDDLLGWQKEAIGAASEAQEAVEQPMNLERARRALTICQRRTALMTQGFVSPPGSSSQLGSYERIDELMCLGRTRRGEWPTWAVTVKEGIERCQHMLHDVTQAIFRCWEEIAERAGVMSVSVQATGMHLAAPDERLEG